MIWGLREKGELNIFPDFLALGLRWGGLSLSGGKILAEEQFTYWGKNECHFEYVVFNVPGGHPNGDIW